MSGWIKLHRSFLNSSIYGNINTRLLAFHLILKANHADNKMLWNGKEMVVQRGQLITGLNVLSRETKLGHKKIRKALMILENVGFLAIKTTNKFSLISICKYNQYQEFENEKDKQEDKQRANRGQTKGKQRATNNNDKNDNNEKKKGYSALVPKATPPHVKFVEDFKKSYEAMTSQPFKFDKVQFILAQNLINAHGLEAVILKAKILGNLCRSQSAWFTKDGWASFTIQKLSSLWNSIIPEIMKTDEQKKADSFEKERRKQEESNARVKDILSGKR